MRGGVLAGTSVPVLLPVPGRQRHVCVRAHVGLGGLTPQLGFGERDGETWGTVLWEYWGAELGDLGYGTMECGVQDWGVWGAAAAWWHGPRETGIVMASVPGTPVPAPSPLRGTNPAPACGE